jgi:hypothetical protein
MQQLPINIEIGTETDFVGASIIETGIPNVPKIISLKVHGIITREQQLELLQKLEQHCQQNPSPYLLIANQSRAPNFTQIVGQLWQLDNTMNFYVLTADKFTPLHQQAPEKLENLESELFLEYITRIATTPDFLKSLQARCQHFSSTIYARIKDGQIVTAAEIHDDTNNGFSIDMLGTIQSAKNQGHGTQLYSYLVGLVLKQNGEHIGNTGSENHAMQRIFQKLGGVLQESQTTWSWLG